MPFIKVQGWTIAPVDNTDEPAGHICLNTDMVTMIVPVDSSGSQRDADLKSKSSIFVSGGIIVLSTETVEGVYHKVTNGGKVGT